MRAVDPVQQTADSAVQELPDVSLIICLRRKNGNGTTCLSGSGFFCQPTRFKVIRARARVVFRSLQLHFGTAYWPAAWAASLMRRLDCLPVADVAHRDWHVPAFRKGTAHCSFDRRWSGTKGKEIWPRHGTVRMRG